MGTTSRPGAGRSAPALSKGANSYTGRQGLAGASGSAEKGIAASLTALLRELAGKLAATADVLHESLQDNTLPDVPDYCCAPASKEFARDVVAYGRRLSFTTFAPLGWEQGQPLGHFRPPAPQDHQLHASTLSRFAVEQEAKKAAEAAARARQPAPAAPTLPAAEAKPAAGSALPRSAPAPIAATGFLPALPAGNGVPDGMPQMPKMPEGWQPGDPLPMDVSMFGPPTRQPEGPGQEAETAFLKQQPSDSDASEDAPENNTAGEEPPEKAQAGPIFNVGFFDDILDEDSDTSESEDPGD
ncbi:hypothetical protein WJX74_002397 [Apatococcus lobatus]|uniref:Mediator complex subunit 4 n=2 Tax=Apatococcus TaxID=904362 RepID=A0AAW1T1K0_9CHLO